MCKQYRFWRPLRMGLEIRCQNVAKYIKAKIPTALIQAVGILYGAPDRHIFVISIEIF